MLTLRFSPPSPFARKVRIAVAILGLDDRVRAVETDTFDAADTIRTQNPLGKIPALILEDDTVLYDSAVIVEYLDDLAGGHGLIPAEGAPRFASLTLQALADGIQDAAVLQRYETVFRDPARHEPKWLAHQAEKVERSLRFLEAAPPSGAIDIGQVAVACALGYLDMRFEGRWRQTHQALVTWLEQFSKQVPAFEATRFVPPPA